MLYFGDVEELLTFLRQLHGEKLVNALLKEGNVSLPLTITYYPDINEYRGVKTIQIIMTNYSKS